MYIKAEKVEIYEHKNDSIPRLIVRIADNVTQHSWFHKNVLDGKIDCIFGENEKLKMQVKGDDGKTYIDSFPIGSKVESYIPF